MDVVVTGIGLVSSLGSLETSWKRLLSGESGIREHQPFLKIESRPLALIGKKPADLITLIRQVLADALQDANLTLPLPDCGIVIGSSRGFQANLEQLASQGSSATSTVQDVTDVRKKEEERRKREEGRGKKEEGRRKREEGRRKRKENSQLPIRNAQCPMPNYRFPMPNAQCPILNS